MSDHDWREVPGCDGRISVTSDGLARSRKGRVNGWTDKDGYQRITIYLANGTKWSPGIHRLVLEAFVGPCPLGHAASHIDGDKTNNTLSNLAWEDWSTNNLRRTAHGRLPLGSAIAVSKLTEDQVRAIRAEYTGERGQLTRLGECYGVSRVNIANIVKGRWWKSIL